MLGAPPTDQLWLHARYECDEEEEADEVEKQVCDGWAPKSYIRARGAGVRLASTWSLGPLSSVVVQDCGPTTCRTTDQTAGHRCLNSYTPL